MKTVISAAGDGTRLGTTEPKPLVHVDDQSLVTHAMDAAIGAGADELILVVKDAKGPIVDEIGHEHEYANSTVPVLYVEQPTPRGLGDAVMKAEPFVDEMFMVILGDTVFHGSVEAAPALTKWIAGVDGTVMTEQVDEHEVSKYAAVYTDGAGQITRIIEKPDAPATTHVDIGVYMLPTAFFDASLDGDGELELQSGLNWLIERGYDLSTVTYTGDRVNVNTPTDLERARNL